MARQIVVRRSNGGGNLGIFCVKKTGIVDTSKHL